MPNDYRAGIGHDLLLAALARLDPQPASDGVQVVERSFGADGTIHDQGQFIVLRYNVLEDMVMYQALMAQFGLTSMTRGAVTLYVPDEQGYDRRYNGWAQRPLAAKGFVRRDFFPRDVNVQIVGLEEI